MDNIFTLVQDGHGRGATYCTKGSDTVDMAGADELAASDASSEQSKRRSEHISPTSEHLSLSSEHLEESPGAPPSALERRFPKQPNHEAQAYRTRGT